MAALRAGRVLAALLALGACNREDRPLKSGAETGPRGVTLTQLQPGAPAPARSDPRAQEYEGNALHISNGQTYYKWFNCAGCHFNGGGGIGPPLMDSTWRYGAEPKDIYASIVQGRPNGMPSYGGHIPDDQVWMIVAYVRSMSGQLRKDVAPSRSDGMYPGNPENARPRLAPQFEQQPPNVPTGGKNP